MERVLESHGPCESLKLLIVGIGLETTELHESRTKRESDIPVSRDDTGLLPQGSAAAAAAQAARARARQGSQTHTHRRTHASTPRLCAREAHSAAVRDAVASTLERETLHTSGPRWCCRRRAASFLFRRSAALRRAQLGRVCELDEIARESCRCRQVIPKRQAIKLNGADEPCTRLFDCERRAPSGDRSPPQVAFSWGGSASRPRVNYCVGIKSLIPCLGKTKDRSSSGAFSFMRTTHTQQEWGATIMAPIYTTPAAEDPGRCLGELVMAHLVAR